MCRLSRLPCASRPGGQLAGGDRVVAAMQHVLLPRPQQLHGRPRHFLGDGHRLAHVVLPAAPAEAAAEQHLVHLALLRLAARPPRRRPPARPRRSGSGTRPRSGPRSRPRSRSSAPWWRGSGRGSCRPPPPSSPPSAAPPWHRPPCCRRRLPPRRGLPSASHRWSPGRPPCSAPHPTRSFSASSAVFACHQVSATTATALSPTRDHLLHARLGHGRGRRRSPSPCRRRPGSRGSRRSACPAASGRCRRPACRWSCPPCRAAAATCRRWSSPSDPSARWSAGGVSFAAAAARLP